MQKYHQAAIAYLIYGLLYLAGAMYLAEMGVSERAMAEGSVWWFVIGGIMVVGLPILIWKEFKWVTRILAVLVFVRILGLLRMIIFDRLDTVPLPWGAELPKAYGAAAFAVIAAVTCAFLVRAGWQRAFKKASRA